MAVRALHSFSVFEFQLKISCFTLKEDPRLETSEGKSGPMCKENLSDKKPALLNTEPVNTSVTNGTMYYNIL